MTTICRSDAYCLVCGSPYVEWHHCPYGTANRAKADKYGLVFPLCRQHHEEAHKGKELDKKLHVLAQRIFEKKYGHMKWMATFHRNYI